MSLLFMLLGILYALLIFYFYYGLFHFSQTTAQSKLTVTVLVPARNEQDNIIHCLESLHCQTYPAESWRVLIIDDDSSDDTAERVRKFISDKPQFTLLQHARNSSQPTYKKQALKFALQQVSSDIVMTIDADTLAQPSWIEKMAGLYEDDTGLVAGVVTFPASLENTFFHKIQTLEFAGIVFCGVGAAGQKNPLICNGSNLSYRLQAFKEAGGYATNEFLPSGDDDLLLQNIQKNTSWKVKYSVNSQTINYTRPVDDWYNFINQRSRWASKSLHYPKKWLFAIMATFYIYYLLIMILFPFTLMGLFPWKFYVAGVLLKIIPEALLLWKALAVLKRRDLMKYFLPAQIFQLSYVAIVGIRGFFHRFSWKER